MKTLQDYIKIYKNVLSNEFCDKILNELKNVNWVEHTFYNSISKEHIDINGTNELMNSWDNIQSKNELDKKVWDCIYQYIVLDFSTTYFDSWNGFNTIRFNKYYNNKKMELHCDHIQSMFDGERKGIPILSILGALNNNYEGGKFLMFDEKIEIKLNKGDIMIFPSNFLYPHEVEPVTKGTRNTFVTWVW
jgi:predicted 2-oxoglutarate/Fe(II)-dependent dioxygenase YbiX